MTDKILTEDERLAIIEENLDGIRAILTKMVESLDSMQERNDKVLNEK